MPTKVIWRASVALNVLAFAVSPAWSQAAPADASAATNAEIVVTGSRLARLGFDTPTPTKVLSSELLQQRASTNVAEFLNEIPAFRPSTGVQNNTQTSGGNAGQSYADLRALGNIRTLTLVNGQRFVPSATTGQVDLNLIPTVLIDRVEVVTGGVSAVYGSDGISGVVNVIVDKKLQGFKGDFSAGVSTHGDDWERRGALGFGTSFSEDRGHIVIGGEYVKSDGIWPFSKRDWGRRNDELVNSGPVALTAAQTGILVARPANTPSRLYASGVQQTNAPLGGVVYGSCTTANCTPTQLALSSPLRGIGFGPGGVVQPFSYGNDVLNTGNATDFTAPDGALSRYNLQIVLPNTRYTAMLHLDYDISDSISAYIDGNYGKSGARFHAAYPRDQNATGLIIRRDNAFLPAALAQRMDAAGVTAVALARNDADWDQAQPKNYNTTERVVAGLNGKLGGNWTWDAYYEYGRNRFDSVIGPIRIEQNFKFAQDAVYYNAATNTILANPASGNIPAGYALTCRALAAPAATQNPGAAGCVPINQFGINAPSAASLNYVNGNVIQAITTTQQVASANSQGDLFDLWAGPVQLGIGAEYRREKAVSVVDSISRARGFNYANPQPYQGLFSVKEAYAEARVPLAKDAAFAKSLQVEGAVRYTDYSISGSVTTWKADATWEPVTGLTFRGTASRDIRAPNSSELFQTTQTTGLQGNPFNGGASSAYTVFSIPSPNLKPEKADTRTAGLIFSPTFIPGLNIAADYYHIKVKGAIGSYGSAATFITNCQNELRTTPDTGGFFCSFFTHSGTTVTALSLQLVNLASITSSGVDFDMNYRHPLGEGNAITARFFGTWVQHITTNDGLGIARTYATVNTAASGPIANVLTTKGSIIDHAGQVGAFTLGINSGATDAPHWQLNGSLTYSTPVWSLTAMGRYIGGGKIDTTLVGPDEKDYNWASPISVNTNKVSGAFYLNLAASVNIIRDGARKVQLYGVVNNVFDKDPPYPTTALSGIYDRIGRFFRLGVRFNY